MINFELNKTILYTDKKKSENEIPFMIIAKINIFTRCLRKRYKKEIAKVPANEIFYSFYKMKI